MKPNQNPPVCRAPRNLQLNTHITVTAILIAALLSVCSWTTIGQSADQGDKDLRQQSLAQLVKLAELATTQEKENDAQAVNATLKKIVATATALSTDSAGRNDGNLLLNGDIESGTA